MSLINDESFGDTLKNGRFSAGIAFLGGAVGGIIKENQVAKTQNVNPWTNKSTNPALWPSYHIALKTDNFPISNCISIHK